MVSPPGLSTRRRRCWSRAGARGCRGPRRSLGPAPVVAPAIVAGVPFPRSSTSSADASGVSRWVASSTARPVSRAWSARVRTSASAVSPSRCSAGSSTSSTRAGARSARATRSRRRSPPETAAASVPTRVSRPVGKRVEPGAQPDGVERGPRPSASVTSPRATRRFSSTVVSKTCPSSATNSTSERVVGLTAGLTAEFPARRRDQARPPSSAASSSRRRTARPAPPPTPGAA